MQIAQMEYREPVERARQFGRAEVMASNFDVFGIFARAPKEPGRHQCRSNERSAEIPVFRMKEIDALAEYPAFALALDAEPLPRVQPPEALFQFLEHAPIYRKTGALPRVFG